jgi:hypothetical protein
MSTRSNDSVAFCARMLAEAGIAATPGVDFDRAHGSRFLRFSYCGPEADMREAAARLRGWRRRGLDIEAACATGEPRRSASGQAVLANRRSAAPKRSA